MRTNKTLSILIFVLLISSVTSFYHSSTERLSTDNSLSEMNIEDKAVPNVNPCSCLANDLNIDQGDKSDSWEITSGQDVYYRTTQSFIPKTPFLTHVELKLRFESGDLENSNLTVWLVNSSYPIDQTTASGAPEPTDFVVKSTERVKTLDIDYPEYKWTMFDLNTNILDIGKTYYLVVKSDSATIRWAGASGNPYLEGGRSTHQTDNGISTTTDMKFRSYGLDRDLDQDQGDFNDDWTVNSLQGITTRTAQSFIPRANEIHQVSLKLYREVGDASNINITVSIVDPTYNIENTVPSGAPTPSTDQILDSRTIGALALPLGQDNATWIDFVFQVPVTVGDTYYIVAHADQSSPHIRWIAAGGNPYLDGGRSTSQETDGVSDYTDMKFQIYHLNNTKMQDQGNFEDMWSVNSYQGIAAVTAQSFVPSESALRSIELKMFREAGDSSSINITLWLVDSTYPIENTVAQGAPLPTSGSIITETTIRASALNVGAENATWIEFDLSSSIVKPGSTHYIVVHADSSTPQSRWIVAGDNPYELGGRSTSSDSDGESDNLDMMFRVYGWHFPLDEEQGDHDSVWSTLSVQDVYYTTAQSFIPRESELAGLSLKMFRETGDVGTTNITISIANSLYPIEDTDTQGAPEPGIGNLIDTVTVGAKMLPIGSGNASWIDIRYHNFVSLTPGETHYIIVSADSTSPSIRWLTASENPYPDGGRSTNSDADGVSDTSDMIFKTNSPSKYLEAYDQGDDNGDWPIVATQALLYNTAQSFVPFKSAITSISLKLFRDSMDNGRTNVTLSVVDSSYPIEDTTSSGSPDPSLGTILGAETIQSGALGAEIGNATWINFKFSPTLSVDPGETYFIVVTIDSSDPAVRWLSAGDNPYELGGRSTGQETDGISSTNDMEFRTYYPEYPYNPIVTKTGTDKEFTEGEVDGTTISISVSDDNAFQYFVLLDGSLMDNQVWRSGDTIEYSVSHLTAGSYEVTFVFMDKGGFMVEDSVTVMVHQPEDSNTSISDSPDDTPDDSPEDTPDDTPDDTPGFNLPGYQAITAVMTLLLLVPVYKYRKK